MGRVKFSISAHIYVSVYHYVSDEQGSITYVLSEDAEILNHYSYDAFGNIIEKTEKVENRFCYNGEMLDLVTQQYYLRARFYNPVIGRFTQEDTYYGDGLNLYQYCQANPLGYVDPSGHNCETTQSRYNSNEEQHPKANAADAYQSATEKGNSKSGSSSLIDIDAIRPKLKTEPDTAFFWSGRTDGIGGAENAANIAKSRGGVTLESTIETQNIVMPEWDFNNPSTMEAWDLASGAYAEQVSGEIRAVIGSELRPGNIWENVELPRLKNNPNVTKITTIDPKTGVENIIFER